MLAQYHGGNQNRGKSTNAMQQHRGVRGSQNIQQNITHHKNDMMAEMNNMHNQMMQGFGGSMLQNDPFANDPFFKDSGFGDMFGQADRMMANMRKDMHRGIGNEMMGDNLGKGQFIQQTINSQTVMDKNGRPVKETYQTRSHGAVGQGKRVVDRQQMYEHTGNGMKKASHERMLNDRGRKVIKEQQGDSHFQSYDHFKNMTSADGQQFDQDWNRVAGQLGFNNRSNALEYGSDPYTNKPTQKNRNSQYAKARGLAMPEPSDNYAEARGLGPSGYVDESRRGHFIPRQARGQNAPVRMNRDAGNDLQPTVPGGRVQPLAPPRGAQNSTQQQPAQQRAIPMGSGPTRAPAAAAAARQARAAPQRINNYQAQNKARGPARAG